MSRLYSRDMADSRPLLVHLSTVDRKILENLAASLSVPMAAVVRMLLRGQIRAPRVEVAR